MNAKEWADVVTVMVTETRRLVPGSMMEAQRPRKGGKCPRDLMMRLVVASTRTVLGDWC